MPAPAAPLRDRSVPLATSLLLAVFSGTPVFAAAPPCVPVYARDLAAWIPDLGAVVPRAFDA